ncbi:MAG: AAA family ATPase [Sporolactobacillus sp.]
MHKGLFLRGYRTDTNLPSFDSCYFSHIPALRVTPFQFSKPVTFLVGENGSGKSTLLEALAVNWGFNPEGGSKNFNFSTKDTHADLFRFMHLVRGVDHARNGFFLRAESFYNVATNVDEWAEEEGGHRFLEYYGGKSLHNQSHGESFLALMLNRFGTDGLYLLDEPEAALSPQKQMTMLVRLHQLVRQNCQFVIATHSPILMAYPDAELFVLSESGMKKTNYRDTDHYLITRHFLEDPQKMLRYLFAENE